MTKDLTSHIITKMKRQSVRSYFSNKNNKNKNLADFMKHDDPADIEERRRSIEENLKEQGNTFRVKTITGSKGHQYYMFVLKRGKKICTCKGYLYRRKCRHIA